MQKARSAPIIFLTKVLGDLTRKYNYSTPRPIPEPDAVL